MKLDLIVTTLFTTILVQVMEGEKDIASYILFPKQGKNFLFDTVESLKTDDDNFSQKWEVHVKDTGEGLTSLHYYFLSDNNNGVTPGSMVALESYHFMNGFKV